MELGELFFVLFAGRDAPKVSLAAVAMRSIVVAAGLTPIAAAVLGLGNQWLAALLNSIVLIAVGGLLLESSCQNMP